MNRPLNNKQQAFVREYVVDKNATQAAIRAGYSQATAGSQGFDLLKKPEIQAEVTKLLAKLAERTETTVERWTRRMWEEADDFSEMASHSARVRALELIGKRYGVFELDNTQKAPTVTTVRLVPLTPSPALPALDEDGDGE